MAAYILGIFFGVGAMVASFVWMMGHTEYPMRVLAVALVLGICCAAFMRIGIYMERRGLM